MILVSDQTNLSSVDPLSIFVYLVIDLDLALSLNDLFRHAQFVLLNIQYGIRIYSHQARQLPLAATLGNEYIDFSCTILTKQCS